MVFFLHMGSLFRIMHWRGDLKLTSLFGIYMTLLPPSLPIMVVWHTALIGSYKINTKGCIKGGFASGVASLGTTQDTASGYS